MVKKYLFIISSILFFLLISLSCEANASDKSKGSTSNDYCSVTFVTSESDETLIKETITGIEKGQKLSSEQLTIESALIPRGHDFAGWICKSNKEIFTTDTAINEDIVLYPSYMPQKYRIEYVIDFIPEGFNQYELLPEYHTYGTTTNLPQDWSWHIEGQNEEIFSIGPEMITDDVSLIGTLTFCTQSNFSENGYFCRSDGRPEPWGMCAIGDVLNKNINVCVSKTVCNPGEFMADGADLYRCNDAGDDYDYLMTCAEGSMANPNVGYCTEPN